MTTLLDNKISLNDFYKNFSFYNNPFNVYTTENEMDFISKTFVNPFNYEAITNAFNNKITIITVGNRGTGKTAILTNLNEKLSKNDISCNIDDYSNIIVKEKTQEEKNYEFYNLILLTLTRELFLHLAGNEKIIKKLPKDDKIFLSFLLQEFVDSSAQGIIVEQIEKIQLNKFKRIIEELSNPIRVLLNYGVNVATNFVNQIIAKHFSMLPSVDSQTFCDIFPDLKFNIETGFRNTDISFRLLKKTCNLIKKLGYNHIVIFFDKMDEDNRLNNDADEIAEFIQPLLTDNKLLLCDFLQLIIFVWEIPFKKIISNVRTQKLQCINISWDKPDLIRALNKRILHFSNYILNDYKELLSDDILSQDIDAIFSLANKNPRDLWHIFNKIFEAQYRIDSCQIKLSKEAIFEGLAQFVKDFNLYEYYPKKRNARANTMDIYSYSWHLLKLPRIKFSKSQLNKYAKTGSSTDNYVSQMERLGLIKATEEREQGGVIYEINDPKIVFALENKIDIRRP